MTKTMTDFTDISYLAEGNPRQRRCHGLLTRIGIMDILSPYDPLLAGTIPIGIDLPQSDLDIVCEMHDPLKFSALLKTHFGKYEKFSLRDRGDGAVVCGFFVDGEEIEIFGSQAPSAQNNAYHHMIVEYRLLNVLGEDFRLRVVELKRSGLKTEPAFAQLLGLPGDPYEALLELTEMSDEQLQVSIKSLNL